MRQIKILAGDRTQDRCPLLLIARSALCAMMPPSSGIFFSDQGPGGMIVVVIVPY
jgi:hypothetical protein